MLSQNIDLISNCNQMLDSISNTKVKLLYNNYRFQNGISFVFLLIEKYVLNEIINNYIRSTSSWKCHLQI